MTLPGVEYVAVERLSVAPWNPREVRTERFEQLCRSLEADPEFLESRPILAQADGTVYAGNHRLLAARHLGWEVVPAIIADVPDLLAKQRAMVDNNNAADWADDSLSDLLAELQAGATDLSLLGFEDGELERLLGKVQTATVEAPEAFAEYDESLETAYECPKCHYEWSGRPKPSAL